MATVVKMPQLGESIVEGTVARWLKQPGDAVAKLEPLLEISTDKIDTELPAPAAGILLQIVAAEGATVAVGGALAYIGQPGDKIEDTRHETRDTRQGEVRQERAASEVVALAEKPVGRAFVSPVVARIAAEHGVDLDLVTGTGLAGRITKKDILAHLAQPRAVASPDLVSRVSESRVSESRVSESRVSESLAPDERLHPLSAMRRAIASHMVQSKATSPHVTTVFEVDMTTVVRHREANKQPFADKGIILTYTSYFVGAVARALRAVPQANSRFTAEGIVESRRIHLGLAVALPDGLLVPVIRDADEKNLQGLARAVNDVANQARSGKLAADATRGGTFTITNHGVGGSLLGTPIINQPQSGILGIGAIVKRPVVRSASASLLPSADDAIVIRPMCYLSFSFDHRVLDGATADQFMTVVKTTLEMWID